MEWIFRNQETVAARSKYIHQLSSSNNTHPIEYFVYCSMGTVKFELLSWFSIVRDFWRQHFSVFSKKTNNISVVSSHFHLYLRISALRLPTVVNGGPGLPCIRVYHLGSPWHDLCLFATSYICWHDTTRSERQILSAARSTYLTIHEQEKHIVNPGS